MGKARDSPRDLDARGARVPSRPRARGRKGTLTQGERMRINARFWIWWADGWVKLTLRRGDVLTVHRGGPTDEGWSSETETYRYDGVFVTCRSETDGRDCDGRLTREAVHRCHVLGLRARLNESGYRPPGGGGVPLWREVSAGQRDYSAEAMGY